MHCRSMARIFLVIALLLVTTGARAADDPVARGKYLVTIGICTSCHLPNFAGGRKTGGILSANITPDRETGIGAWTEQQFLDAIRNGKRPDGAPVRPTMGVFWYHGLTDTDARAIFAYLRTVAPVHTTFARSPDSRPPPKYAPPVATVPDVARSDQLAYGRYIGATVAHCMQCHTPRGKDGNPDLTRLGAGGNTYNLRGAGGGKAVSANITPANPDGMARWTDEQVKRAITHGIRPDGSKLAAVMDFELYEQITPEDLDALVVFLRSLKPMSAK